MPGGWLVRRSLVVGYVAFSLLAEPGSPASFRPLFVEKGRMKEYWEDASRARSNLVNFVEKQKEKLKKPPELMPGHAYKWDDPEHNWDRTHALIDWAEGRTPKTYEELKKMAGGNLRKSTLSFMDQGKMSPGDILRNWRIKKQLKVMDRERSAVQKHRESNNVARVQNAIRDANDERDDAKAAAGVQGAVGNLPEYKASKQVAGVLSQLGTALHAAKDKGMLGKPTGKGTKGKPAGKGTNLLETMGLRPQQAAAAPAAFSPKSFQAGQQVMLKRLDQTANTEIAKMKEGQRAVVDPLALSFLQTSQPVSPAKDWQDFQTLVPNKQNLHQRLLNDYNMEPRERLMERKKEERVAGIQRMMPNGATAEFLDTSKVPETQIGTGLPIADTMDVNYRPVLSK